jgi:hypothetical protein
MSKEDLNSMIRLCFQTIQNSANCEITPSNTTRTMLTVLSFISEMKGLVEMYPDGYEGWLNNQKGDPYP